VQSSRVNAPRIGHKKRFFVARFIKVIAHWVKCVCSLWFRPGRTPVVRCHPPRVQQHPRSINNVRLRSCAFCMAFQTSGCVMDFCGPVIGSTTRSDFSRLRQAADGQFLLETSQETRSVRIGSVPVQRQKRRG